VPSRGVRSWPAFPDERKETGLVVVTATKVVAG
jgi:hypothetical protein